MAVTGLELTAPNPLKHGAAAPVKALGPNRLKINVSVCFQLENTTKWGVPPARLKLGFVSAAPGKHPPNPGKKSETIVKLMPFFR